MRSRVDGRWRPRLLAIIGVALAALLLSGCGSLVRLGYGQAPTLAYWWVDGYLDLDDTQSTRLRTELDQWFDWHRRQQLPDYAALLARAQREVTEPITTQGMCAWRELALRRLDSALERAAPPLGRLIVTLRPEQIRHMERKLAKDGAELRADFAQADRDERARASFKRTLERYENLYGRLDDAQRARLAQLLAASPFDADAWLAERERRNADMLRAVSAAAAGGDAAQAQAAVFVIAERALRSPRLEYRAYQERLVQENCALAAAMHNLTTPAQRQHARGKLKGWEDDLRVLAGTAVGQAAR
jgi:Family of unknown function (DUF6279)